MTAPETPIISDAGGDTSSVTDTTSQVSDVVTAPAPSFIDPETIYSKLPDAFKEGKLLDSVLSEYNEKHNSALSELQNQYSALDPFKDVDPQKLAYALQIFDMIDNNPQTARQVYDQLGQAYGFSAQQIQQAVEENKPTEVPDEELTPEQLELKQLRQQVEEMRGQQGQFNEHFQQQVHQERTQQYSQEIDKALEPIFQTDPGLKEDPVRFNDLMARVRFADQEDLNNGRNPRPFNQLLSEAHQAQKAYNQRMYAIFGQQGQSTPSRNAPMVMSPTGSTPAPNNDYAGMSESQLKEAAVAKLLEAANQ